MDTVYAGVQAAPHTLDPLSPVGDRGRGAHRPRRARPRSRHALRNHRAARAGRRHGRRAPRVRFDIRHRDRRAVRSDRVADRRRLVESWTPRPGAMPRIAPDEFLLAEEIAKRDPRFIAALAKRGITDLSLVCSDPWSCGVFGHEDEKGRRLIQTITWVRNGPFDNHYAHPVEGLSALVDINRGEVCGSTISARCRCRARRRNYSARFQKTWRSGVKPIEVIQPEGPSFTVDGWAVEWCGWKFRIGFTPREGLVLYDLKIRDGDDVAQRAQARVAGRDGGAVRPPVRRASAQERVRLRRVRHRRARQQPHARLRLPWRDPLLRRRGQPDRRQRAGDRERHLPARGRLRHPLEAHRFPHRGNRGAAQPPAGDLVRRDRRQLRIRLLLAPLSRRHDRAGRQADRYLSIPPA